MAFKLAIAILALFCGTGWASFSRSSGLPDLLNSERVQILKKHEYSYNLVAGMKWLQGTYTQRYNGRHKVFGHRFQGRYKAVIVDGRREEDYFSSTR